MKNEDVFKETAQDLFDLPELRGFAHCWSLIHFKIPSN